MMGAQSKISSMALTEPRPALCIPMNKLQHILKQSKFHVNIITKVIPFKPGLP